MEKEESIDLKVLLQIIMKYKKKLMAIVVACTALAMILAFFVLPKTYESTALVQAKSPNSTGLSAAAGAMAMLGGNVSTPTMGYIEMMKSRTIIEPIIAKVKFEDEEDRAKMLVKDFVKKRLEIKNTKGTDLIEITANAKNPEEAQMITSDVINGFFSLMTQLNQNEQSTLMKFLNERIEVSKKEMDEAEQKLEDFRQKEKIYLPDEQAQAVIKKMTAYDKVLSELAANTQSSQAYLANVNQQLNKQNFALKEFQVTDNGSIQKIRDSIIEKQMSLIEHEQRYTDKHPTVILLKQEIEELNKKLKQEVDQSVDAGTNTLNPIHAGLLKAKVEAETSLAMDSARKSKIEQLLSKAEEDMSKLSTASMEYVKLSRDVDVTRDVYTTLIKNYENARIQEAMDSMDIQIIDAADLPKKPAGPKKLLITVIGGVVGMMVAFGYSLFLYSRRRV